MACVWQKDETFVAVGGYGHVSLYRNEISGKCLAVKVAKFKPDDNVKNRTKMFLEEYKLMSTHRHRNIVQAFEMPSDLHIDSIFPIIAMEFCGGGDLNKLLTKPENICGLREVTVCSIVRDISAAIEYLHSKDIVHSDIKPHNILLGCDDHEPARVVYKLGDMGFAQEIKEGDTFPSQRGTIPYWAPEICDRQAYDRTADYWSYGTVVFECITGKRPFFHDQPWVAGFERMKRKKRTDIYGIIFMGAEKFFESIPKPHQLNDILQKYMEQWLRLMLECDRELRGGKLDPTTNKRTCFRHLESITSVQYVKIFCPLKNELLSHPVHERSKTLGSSIRDVLQSIQRQKGVRFVQPLLIRFNGERVADEDSPLKHVTSYEDKEDEYILYLFDKSLNGIFNHPSYLIEHKHPSSETEPKTGDVDSCAYCVHKLSLDVKQLLKSCDSLSASVNNDISQLAQKSAILCDHRYNLSCQLKFFQQSLDVDLKQLKSCKILQSNQIDQLSEEWKDFDFLRVELLIHETSELEQRCQRVIGSPMPGVNRDKILACFERLCEETRKVYEEVQRSRTIDFARLTSVRSYCTEARDFWEKLAAEVPYVIRNLMQRKAELQNFFERLAAVSNTCAQCSSRLLTVQRDRQESIWRLVARPFEKAEVSDIADEIESRLAVDHVDEVPLTRRNISKGESEDVDDQKTKLYFRE